jgi:hypothetical protein
MPSTGRVKLSMAQTYALCRTRCRKSTDGTNSGHRTLFEDLWCATNACQLCSGFERHVLMQFFSSCYQYVSARVLTVVVFSRLVGLPRRCMHGILICAHQSSAVELWTPWVRTQTHRLIIRFWRESLINGHHSLSIIHFIFQCVSLFMLHIARDS